MVETASVMLPLGTAAPDFSLPDVVEGKAVSLADFADAPVLLVIFMCNHCPYVKHVAAGLADLVREYQGRGVAVVGINSNDVESFPADAPPKMAEEVKRRGYTFPYLYDETQEVARAYQAACTPDFYVFDKDRKLVYRGQMDASRPGSGIPVTGQDLRAALDAVLAGRPVPERQRPSLGCNIKWKPGNAPDYFG
jgi:peroxiredoxin